MLLYNSSLFIYPFYWPEASSSPFFFPFASIFLSSLPLCESEKLDNSYLSRALDRSCSLIMFWGVLWPTTEGDFIPLSWVPWLSGTFGLSVSSLWSRIFPYNLGVCRSIVGFLLGIYGSRFIRGESIMGA